MPSAEVITIGTELLLGEILDTNANYLARTLRQAGVDLFRITTIGDNVRRIALAIQDSLARSDFVITTGGLGPTVDDPTRDAVAMAMGVPTEYRPELWEQIVARFKRYGREPTENNRKQAFIPRGAIAVENRVGTAPSFIVEQNHKSIISLPGVPREMEYLMENDILPYLKRRYNLHEIIQARIIHTAGIGESLIDDKIADLETMSNPTVGLAAHSGQVDVRITAKADSKEAAEAMIQQVEAVVRERLGEWIYGMDEDTLEGIALAALKRRGWKLAVMECALKGELIKRLSSDEETFLEGKVLPKGILQDELAEAVSAYRQRTLADVVLGVSRIPAGERQEVFISLATPDSMQNLARPYGGAAGNAVRYAVNHCLNLLRNV